MAAAKFNYQDNVGGSLHNKLSDTFLGTNKEASAKANYQMQFAEHMSNTAVQRKVADMQAAGINPMIASSQAASGADTPSGAPIGGTGEGFLLGQAKGLLTSALKPLNKILDGSAKSEVLKALK